MNDSKLYFPHEKLDCYQLAEDVARWVANQTFKRGDADLRDQAGEACSAIGMARLDGAKAQQDKLRRVGLMLRAMIR
jgi:hypothetical protein